MGRGPGSEGGSRSRSRVISNRKGEGIGATRVRHVGRGVCHVAIQVEIKPGKSEWVFTEEATVGGGVIAGPHEVQPGAFLHDPKLSDECERVRDGLVGEQWLTERVVVVAIEEDAR